MKKVGSISEIQFSFYWWTWKTTTYLKNCWKEPTKNVRILIFTILYLKKNWRKTPGDIIILHLSIKNDDDIIYNSWDIQFERLKLVIMGHFLPFCTSTPKNLKNQNLLKKWKKLLEISCYTCVPKTTIIWGMISEIRSETHNFLSFLANFCRSR